MTFERTDPFYKLDVQNPRNIRELAAVEITGFSQYLHPFDDSEEMIIALGQEADDQGRVLGLQISLFDMRQSQKPEVIRHNIEVDPDKWSSSEALWDPKAVRFNKKTGLLIIPVNLEKSEPEKGYFNGFKIFTVTETSVTEHTDCSIDLAGSVQYESETETNVYYCAWLPPVSYASRVMECLSVHPATHFSFFLSPFAACHDFRRLHGCHERTVDCAQRPGHREV